MNSYSSSGVQREQVCTTNQRSPTPQMTILKFLRRVAGNSILLSDFSQIWVMHEFQLGDDLASYTPDQQIEDSRNFLFLVCKGRVRLLGFDTSIGREVSTHLLLAEQTFGVDDLFYYQPLPYRAVAASDGFIAYICLDSLKQWLEQLPDLNDYLQQATYERQALIFFKTATELRSHTSHTLQKLVSHLVKTKISAGSSLVEVTSSLEGRFWLVHGKISSSSTETQPPMVGESWDNPNLAIPNWTAGTELVTYHVSKENWESVAAIAPEISLTRQEEQDKGKEDTGARGQGDTGNLEDTKALSSTEIDFCVTRNQHRLAKRFWRRYPFIGQQDSSDCGAACLAMISLYWGKRLSLTTLRNFAQTNRTGTSLTALADAAEVVGYDTLPVRASLSKLELQAKPWIAHWQGIHFVVVWRVKGDRVLISDPAIGKRSLHKAEFEANWTGYALLLFPTERLEAKQSKKTSFGSFWYTFWHQRQLLGQIILASVLLQVFALAVPIISQVVLDRVLPYKSLLALNVFAICFLFFGFWRITIQAVRQYLLDYLSNHMDLAELSSFMSHILRLPLQFFASRQVGDIITRIQENRKIQLFFAKQAIVTTLDALMVVAYLGLMVYYNLRLTCMVVGLILLIAILTVAANPFLKNLSRELLHKSAAQNSALVEIVAGIATVKAAATENLMRWRWEERLTSMVQTRFRAQKLANNLQLATSLSNHLGTTALFWYGATLVINEEMSVGQFVAFSMMVGGIVKPVLALVGLWDDFQEVAISLEHLNDVLATQPEANLQKLPLELPQIRGDVHFENVSFLYNTDAESNTLQDISFQVKAGQTIAVVGASGSGKSTLVNLLVGLYRPHSGRVLIDGYDIANVSPQSLRNQLGVVPQDIFLFTGTILENITLFNSEISLEQAIAAAKLTEAHSFIQALPLGYNTRVGEGAMMLSGKQRQRIAIARALVRKPRILILDEATTYLDAESEQRFYKNLVRFNHLNNTYTDEAITKFIITHRISTISYADYILVLDQGILVEQGTHQQLMGIRSLYYHLFQQQSHLRSHLY
ncbi:cysteine peptidase family C39 domain-containing protein [Chlorogloeopsis sp. ULAP01]|uniref:ABC transporter transmembrane domain-containing protein n=1 Tax=Chlorogloeopsis sp. ULAP01 TaxID=3056483 RepID=UPI0025AA9499|nr:ABC transporter transmembrane domain-containing protein [Chlorogloeopsis sp. ULAP01]MDM9382867.1 cysteine peptidase family C39 domain-containing protein [Chlorogloeopsis sp. ULAP01]